MKVFCSICGKEIFEAKGISGELTGFTRCLNCMEVDINKKYEDYCVKPETRSKEECEKEIQKAINNIRGIKS